MNSKAGLDWNRKGFEVKRSLSMLLFLVALFVTGCAGRQKHYTPSYKYAPELLRQDAAAMWTTFQKCHPSLYWYSSPQTIDSAFNSLINNLNDSLTEQAFRLRLSETVALIHCGHTSIRPSKAAARYRSKQKTLIFPLQVKVWDRDSMVILANANRQDTNLVRGVVVHSINNRPVGEIVDTITRFISADGLHPNFKYQLISNNFPSWYKAIIGLSDAYVLDVTGQDGVRRTDTIKNFDPALSDSLLKAAGKKPAFSLPRPAPLPGKKSKYDNDRKLLVDSANSLAIMELNTFSFARLHHFFRVSFKQMKKANIKYLAIELRNNGGGNIMNSTLLTRYISDHKFKVADTVAAQSFHYPFHGTVKNGFFYALQSWFVTRKMADGRLHYRTYEKKYFKPKKRNHFDGQVFIITGGFTFSASTLFINPIQGQQNVTVMGEETGGGAYGNSAVNIPDMFLPNTGIRVRLPLYRVVISKDLPKDGHGILPDIYVPPNSWHIGHRLDPKMMRVYEIIRGTGE